MLIKEIRERINLSQDKKASSIEEFVPALTSDDLSNVLKAVEISLRNDWIYNEKSEK